MQFWLAERYSGTAYVVGAQALVDHVADAGLRVVNHTPFASRADVVVVAAHDDLVYEEIRIAAQAVIRGAELIGATRDANFPMPDGLVARHGRRAGGDRGRGGAQGRRSWSASPSR